MQWVGGREIDIMAPIRSGLRALGRSMSRPALRGASEKRGRITVRVFDGRRDPFPADTALLARIRDGFQNEVFARYARGPVLYFEGLPVYDNLGDRYTVVLRAEGYEQAGIGGVRVSPDETSEVDLMLLPQSGRFNFSGAMWTQLRAARPRLWRLLTNGVEEDQARRRYEDAIEMQALGIGGLLGLMTAIEQTPLGGTDVLAFMRELIWQEPLNKDRFFAFADPRLLEEVKKGVRGGMFKRAHGHLHPGSTSSYKEVRFDGANLQLTFYEKDLREIGGMPCVKVEVDIDLYRDVISHYLLEVLPHWGRRGHTDPRAVYQLRWMEMRRSGLLGFDPPFTVDS
ncbi:MAG: carboxypeptidase regulatory-like domain-containing protein [Elusimicrobia bacterium]|nr:carboxypeptidase regulatory-like domain-containing protein [Elusimicrobiota bacterium]